MISSPESYVEEDHGNVGVGLTTSNNGRQYSTMPVEHCVQETEACGGLWSLCW